MIDYAESSREHSNAVIANHNKHMMPTFEIVSMGDPRDLQWSRWASEVTEWIASAGDRRVS